MHNTQYGKVDADLHVISQFHAPTPTHTLAGSHVCLTTILPHIFKQKSYFPHIFILMLHNYFGFQIALQIQTLAHTHTHTESPQSLDFRRKGVFWVYACMRVVNFPSSYNKQCANLEERSLRFEEAALLGTYYTREMVLLVREYLRGRRQVEMRWVSGAMRQSLGGGGGRLSRVCLVTVIPPFLRLASAWVWVRVWLCAWVWVYTWMSGGFSLTHRGEGDVRVVAMLVGVE